MTQCDNYLHSIFFDIRYCKSFGDDSKHVGGDYGYKNTVPLYVRVPGIPWESWNAVDMGVQLYTSSYVSEALLKETGGKLGPGLEDTWISQLTFGLILAMSLEGTSYSKIFALEMQKSELLAVLIALQGVAGGVSQDLQDGAGAGHVCQLPSCWDRPAGALHNPAGNSGGAGEGCVNMTKEAELFRLGRGPSGTPYLPLPPRATTAPSYSARDQRRIFLASSAKDSAFSRHKTLGHLENTGVHLPTWGHGSTGSTPPNTQKMCGSPTPGPQN